MTKTKMEFEELRHYKVEEKREWWGDGEWCNEPDEVKFTYKGIECKVFRQAYPEPYTKELHMFGGFLCGYVRIPEDHPYQHKCYEDMAIDCHYGLTYGEVTVGHWIGFDCAHTCDYMPSREYFKKTNESMKEFNKIFPIPEGYEDCALFHPTYKNISYCIGECKSIVEQLLAIKLLGIGEPGEVLEADENGEYRWVKQDE